MNGVWIFVNVYPLIKILKFIFHFSFLLCCFFFSFLVGIHCLKGCWVFIAYG
jgi:hypothetical protein